MQSATGSIYNGGDECDDVGRAPTFTADDEHRELATLSMNEIVSVQSDLQGIASGVANLSTDASSRSSSRSERATKVDPAVSIPLLDHALTRLPAAKTTAYRRAVAECPALVSNERKIPFLEREDNDIDRAAVRLARYWEARLHLFGSDRCFLSMTLDGAMKDEARNITTRRIFQVMPVKDTAGRAIIYGVPSRRNFAEYSMDQEIMLVWYLLETCIEDPEVRRRGVVFVADARNMQRKHYSRKLHLLTWLLNSVVPVRIRGFHFCYPSKVAYFVLHPVLKHALGRDFRLRFKMHFGLQARILRDLEGYCLPRDCLPVELGGTVVLDVGSWMKARMELEATKPCGISHVATLTDESSDLSAEPAGPSSKRLCRKNRQTIHHVAPAPSMPNPNESRRPTPSQDEPPQERHAKRKGRARRGPGRKPDPRMTKAAEAKMKDPSLSLRDALLLGGFIFNSNDVDADNITFRQRTNNLCRRIRTATDRQNQEVEKKGEERRRSRSIDDEKKSDADDSKKMSSSPSETSEVSSAFSNVLEEDADKAAATIEDSSMKPAAKGATGVSKDIPAAVVQQSRPRQGAATPPDRTNSSSDPSHGTGDGIARRASSGDDSFADKIMDLPGIDDLGCFDILGEDESIAD